MIFRQISVGMMQNFAYLFGDKEGGEGFVVDPAFENDKILAATKEHRLNITRIVLTHHHFDHVDGAKSIKARTGAKIIAHPETASLLKGNATIDAPIKDDEGFECGTECRVRILHTPGHAPGAICLLVGEKWLVTGDTLFIGNCGRTDLEGGNPKALFESLAKIKRLPDDLIICPGHNYGTATSRTLGEEKKSNPTLSAKTYQEFLAIP